jgi:uncharacterized protein (DUF1810 family)
MAAAADPFALQRFVRAQAGVYEEALAELRGGRKRTHWMWFIFPQIQGLGYSATSRHYAIKSLAEAREYLRHPVLGPRLQACAEAVLAVEGKSASAIFSYPDDLKLHSSMTLFAATAGPDSVFARVLDKYFAGSQDQGTLRELEHLKE